MNRDRWIRLMTLEFVLMFVIFELIASGLAERRLPWQGHMALFLVMVELWLFVYVLSGGDRDE